MVGENENMDLPFADETLLARWLSGELTEEERRKVEEHPHFSDWQRLALAAGELQAPAYDEATNWQQIQAKKDLAATTSRRRMSVIGWWPAAAAVLLLTLTAFLLWPAGQQELLVMTNSGEQQQQQLPDASLVTLNAESSISYLPDNWTDNRVLELNGEAFFEVEEGSRFLVQSSQGEVEVLGTSFNVYARDDGFKVYCFTGRVAVRQANGVALELRPGQGVSFIDGQREALYSRDRESPGWTRGETNFRNASPTEVFVVLERQFGVTVSYDELPNLRYTGPLPHTELEQALQVVCPPLRLRYQLVDEQNVRISPLED